MRHIRKDSERRMKAIHPSFVFNVAFQTEGTTVTRSDAWKAKIQYS
jgi:hypothetical protein